MLPDRDIAALPQTDDVTMVRDYLNVRGQRVADIGCGTGGLANVLAADGGVVCGLDPDAKRIRTAHAAAMDSDRPAYFTIGAAHTVERVTWESATSGYLFLFSDLGTLAELQALQFCVGDDAFGIGASFVYVKKYMLPLDIPASALITYQLGLGIIILLIAIDTSQISRISENTSAALGLIVGLGIIGTAMAYIMYYTIIDKLGAVTSSSVAYIPPIVALLIGSLIVGENILLVEFIGAASILAGLALINRAKPAGNWFRAE